ncbi:ribonucleoside-diphosphate reductase alpha chain/ribonucleoside-triphosphate reductase [Tindallia magadiensis]|uniref:Adenosylcobalamin-dependent ribonucleoside-triphosphate reductase n=1 Tax=Tindallia magadiensis TaxID=69895 RepID=A0A1I3HRV5_9FIRM|nr:ribonucleoside-triphosphate reductase, adenosylcobalamin-dependent [Tindallia magadiensis]SFI38230.1 ribonucleoside-diphosphate reductase alpha chain/ribonucleoside-triphosphate reductase [Tindallia magadiensis]
MKIQKRDGRLMTFERVKISNAIQKAMAETKGGIDDALSESIAKNVEESLMLEKEPVHVETIQDWVEYYLMDSSRKDVAKNYIIYRNERNKSRALRMESDYQMIRDEFVSRYKHMPNPMEQLGSFVYYRTYSRWLQEENRREYWWETVRRAVDYNTSLVQTTKEEAEKLYDNVFRLKQFLSGRTFWVGNTDVAKNYPMSNYNCAFIIVNSLSSLKELFYLLMLGSGVGARILYSDVASIPKVRCDYELIHKDYMPVPPSLREDNTSIQFMHNNTVKITVGDSKEGWTQSLDHFFQLLSNSEYKNIKTIVVDYDHVRPEGEKLKTFGGTASGHTSLKNMFAKIDYVIRKRGWAESEKRVQLQPVDMLDVINIIGENVVVGGVRRTAEMVLLDPQDHDSITAKESLYKNIDGQWIVDKELIHRQMSNNSIYYEEKPDRETLHWMMKKMRFSGEPGFINAKAASKRRENLNGVNPCGEILLDSRGVCNLTTINVYAFVSQEGSLDWDGLLEAQKLSVRAAYRMTCVELELPGWDAVQRRDKLVGCSLTGWQDMVNALNMDREEQIRLLKALREVARKAVDAYADEIGENRPLLVTTVKPEGTLSQLPTVSSGVHYSHSPYYLRRIRVSAQDPLVKVCEELGYSVHPEVGQTEDKCTTKVVEFPVKAPEGKTKYDVGAIEQLENYKMFMEHYVDHNCSITVHVRDHEWEAVEEWMWNNWDDVVAVSFLSLSESFYQLMPYESIDKEEYEEKSAKMKPFIASLLSKYENPKFMQDIGDESCENGVCPIR